MLTDSRSVAQRNLDRFYYLPAWRRLAHVTQVTDASGKRSQHNRLTHTLKVAQVARRLAESLVHHDEQLAQKIDPDVVAAAAYAHDLGHPPFGHNGEAELDQIARKYGLDGFEGNAQTFRILTRLTTHVSATESRRDISGLGLDARVVAASVKYPYARDPDRRSPHYKKFGYYRDDAAAFEKLVLPHVVGKRPTLEAQIMDWADDITYALHDVEDFYAAALIPLHALRCDEKGDPIQPDQFAEFHEYAMSHLGEMGALASAEFRAVARAFPTMPFDGTDRARARLARFTSDRISSLISEASVDADGNLDRGSAGANDALLSLMKQLTWFYVIDKPELGRSQIGARNLLKNLVSGHMKWARSVLSPVDEHGERRSEDERAHGLRKLPPALAELLRNNGVPLAYMRQEEDAVAKTCRAVIDYVSSLTEDEAVEANAILSATTRTGYAT